METTTEGARRIHSVRRVVGWVLALVATTACPSGDDDGGASTSATSAADTTDATTSSSSTPVSYAACDDPELGCDEADCRRRTDAAGSWSVCVAPCTEDADCPIVGAGNVSPVCDASGRCSLECVPQVLTCASGTTCIDGDPPQCMWPDAG